ncbi:MAG: carbon monoxide dehydrogenase maturation protein [Actinomycetota bacterium]|nr:carbon monoxide dehydrogenase maturation protein [Actinomycetota bacterium]
MGSVVAFGSVRSCGVTTLVLGLAATWPSRAEPPGRPVLVVEADPAGGTLAALAGWPAEPGLVSLAAAARRGAEPSLVFEHCQHLPGGAAVLAGPARGDQARSALAMLAPLLGRLDELDADVLVDCGRLEDTSAVLGIFERAAQSNRESSAVLVSRGRLADLQAVASWLDAHPAGPRTGLVIVGDGPYPDAEVTEALGLSVLGRMPWDPGTPDALVALGASDRRLRMAPLMRAARTLVERLAADGSSGEPGDKDLVLPEQPVAGRRIAVGSRVLRAWRAETVSQTNGHAAGRAPGEASR